MLMIGSAMVEQVQKHHEHHDGALSTPPDWSRQLIASVSSRVEVKRNIETQKKLKCIFFFQVLGRICNVQHKYAARYFN